MVSPGLVATGIRGRAFGPDGKPRTESPRDESHGNMSVEECVAILLRAMERRDREVVMTRMARFGQWMKLVAPRLVDRFAERSVREK